MDQQLFSYDRDGEIIFHEIAEAVEDFCENAVDDIKQIPEYLDMWVFEREVISHSYIKSHARRALEMLLESLDEDYGPEDNYTEETQSMKEAAETFVSAVVRHYQVYRFENKGRITVRVAEYWTP